MFALYVSANHGYVTFARYYAAETLKLFSSAEVNTWLGLGTKNN